MIRSTQLPAVHSLPTLSPNTPVTPAAPRSATPVDGFAAREVRPAGPDLGAAHLAKVAPRPAGFEQQGAVLPADGVWIRPLQETVQVFDQNPPTYGTGTHPMTSVELSLSLDDASLRQQLPGFDGLERPFVMIPSEKDGQITWWRHELEFAGPGREGFFGERDVDTYRLNTVRGVDRAAVEKYGVLVGVDTNVGTAWAQQPGASHTVPERSRS